MKFEKIVYLDTPFISSAYEEITGSTVATKITRSEDFSSDVSGKILGIGGSVGASSKETKEFQTTSERMFFQLESELEKILAFNLSDREEKDYPPLFWTHGFLGFGMARRFRNNEIKDEDHFFHIASDDTDQATGLDLLTEAIYFTSGFDRLLKYNKTISETLWLKVKVLVRTLYHNPHTDFIKTVVLQEKACDFLLDPSVVVE